MDLSPITTCGIFITGPRYWNGKEPSSISEPEGWVYPHEISISQTTPHLPNHPMFQFVVGLHEQSHHKLLMSFYETHRVKNVHFWISALTNAVSNVVIHEDAPEDIILAVLNLPSIARLGLKQPNAATLRELQVKNIPNLQSLGLVFREAYDKGDAIDIIRSLNILNIPDINIICKGPIDPNRCGFLSLLGQTDPDPFSKTPFFHKIKTISCSHIMKGGFHPLLYNFDNLRRIQVYEYSDIDALSPILLPPLEVEMRDDASKPEAAARLGKAVTVFVNSLFELSLQQILKLQACTEMKDLTIMMQQDHDWKLAETMKKMQKLERLQICGDDSSEDINDPVVKALPSGMWTCVKSCPLLTKLYFNTILISSSELDLIIKTVGPKLESFTYGIYKQENHPEEKFVDIMLSVASHCGGDDSQLKFLGIPDPRRMNMNKGDIEPIPRWRREVFWSAAKFLKSRCPKLPRKCIDEVWEVICEHERKNDTPGQSSTFAPPSPAETEFSEPESIQE